MNPLTSHRKAQTLAIILFLFGLVILILTQNWWPGIMLAAGFPIILRQFLLGRIHDVGISLFIFVGTFISVQFEIAWKILLPVLFSLGGIYILFREFFGGCSISEAEEEEDHNLEIEEDQQKKKK